MRSAIPCYFHPVADPQGWEWVRRSNVSFAVVNPHNGPGVVGDPYYTPLLRDWEGPRLCGYVNLDHGHRNRAEVLHDADLWKNYPAVSGLMLDCFPVDEQMSSQTTLIAELRIRGCEFIVTNPGREAPEDLLMAADITCTAEMDWTTYVEQTFVKVSGSTWHIVHSVPPTKLRLARDLLRSNGATHGWVTPDSLPHPYGWNELTKINE